MNGGKPGDIEEDAPTARAGRPIVRRLRPAAGARPGTAGDRLVPHRGHLPPTVPERRTPWDPCHRAGKVSRPETRAREAMTNDKAAEAREGVFDSVAGKAKEVAGAVSGTDELVEEGQLQQAEARKRKAAVADEALGDAKRHEAAEELRESRREATQQKVAARAKAAAEESDVERQRETERAAAARDATQQAAAGREAAEERADEIAVSRLREAEAVSADASRTEAQANAEKRRLEREAADAEQEAAELRAQTEK